MAIAAGGSHAVALRTDGTVRAWGSNSSGQTNVSADLGPVTAISAGSAHTVALRTDGVVRAWGNNGNGQTNVPSDLGLVTAIAAGDFHTVALCTDGTVRAWGYNGYGQTNIPIDLGPATAIAAGGSHTVALRLDGTGRAWGGKLKTECGATPIHSPTSLALARDALSPSTRTRRSRARAWLGRCWAWSACTVCWSTRCGTGRFR
jgi:alpha-tubulin suppressor-like RCC1 family protein